ncbi:hypothetical protein PHYBOEH_004857 [Phytophthora boehmeriae]|uniref:C2 domain-containing protein n=1 Tax=Phytophthora boehmeriae TaxID=109152 RepID=A0A8T1WSC8_9STRA|nr:hypothetical protein PHYBOEH_004857 [Phytophthora boehmeriae]
MAPAADPPRYKLVLRVHSAEELQHSSSQGAYCKLYVGPTAMTDGSHKALAKKDSTESNPSAEELDEHWQLEVRRTRTVHQQPNALAPPETIWDEVFEVPVHDLNSQILSIRVKSQHMFFCPVIGACAVSLANLCLGERLEQWFPLKKGKKNAGRIRVMLLIAPDDMPLVPRRKQMNQDVMAARAAHHEADEAIKRLVDKQLREEAERRQRRLHRTASGPPVDVNRPPEDNQENSSYLRDRQQDDEALSNRRKKGANATWPPPPGVSSPKILPPLGTPAVYREDDQVDESPSPPSDGQSPVSPMEEYEQRLDRKLRQVRKETARLRKLKAQLKKYIPDLQTDSDSEDELSDSEEEAFGHRRSSLSSSASTSSDRPRGSYSNKENHHRLSNEVKQSRVKSAPSDGMKLHDALKLAKR